MARLLSRAYEQLNKVLSLAGSQSINDIDIDQAFAVHDLAAVLQSSLVKPVTYFLNDTTTAGAVVNYDLRPWVAADWTSAESNGTNLVGAAAFPDIDRDDILITHMGAFVAGGANLDAVQFALGMAGAGTNYIPVTNDLTRIGTALNVALPTAGDPYYCADLPLLFRDDAQELMIATDAGAGGNLVLRIFVTGFYARKGVFPSVSGR